MYTVERESPEQPESRSGFKTPSPSVVLRFCRCVDCRRWDRQNAACHEMGLVAYVPQEAYHPAMRGFWSDVGMVRLDAWHYCASYDGTVLSNDVWVLPKVQKQAQSERAPLSVPEPKPQAQRERVNVPVRAPKAIRRNVPTLFDGVRAKQDVLVEPVVVGRAQVESECAK